MIVLVALLFSLAAAADALPALTGPVNDFAHVIDARSAAEMDRLSRELKAASGDVVVVATVKTIEPYGDIREYANKLFENHGRGIGENRAELEREGVEGSLEFVRRHEERRREPGVVPRRHTRRAGAQIVGRDRVDDRQRVRERGGGVSVRSVAGRRVARARPVHDQRLQTRAENRAEVALEQFGLAGDRRHTGIIDECDFGS